MALGDEAAEQSAREALRAEKSAVIDLLLGTDSTRPLRREQVRALNEALRHSVATDLVVDIDASHLREMVDGGYDREAIGALAGALEAHARYTEKARDAYARFEATGNEGLRDHAGRLEAKAISERDRLLATLEGMDTPASPAPAEPLRTAALASDAKPGLADRTPERPAAARPAARDGEREDRAARAQARREARDVAALSHRPDRAERKRARKAARRAARQAAPLAAQEADPKRDQARKAARLAAREAAARAAPQDADLRRETRREARRAARAAARAAARDAASQSARKAARREARREARSEARQEARRAVKREARKAEKRQRRKPKKIR